MAVLSPPRTFNTGVCSCSLLLFPRIGQDCTKVQGKSQQTLSHWFRIPMFTPLWTGRRQGDHTYSRPHRCFKPLLTSMPSQQSGCFECLWRGSTPCPPDFSLVFLLSCLLSPFYTPTPSFCTLTTSWQRCGLLLRKQVGTGWVTKAPPFPKSTYRCLASHPSSSVLFATLCKFEHMQKQERRRWELSASMLQTLPGF